MIDLICRVETRELKQLESVPNALAEQGKYTVYLFDGAVPIPVETVYNNKTAVITPRITAMRLLLKATAEGLMNPFPQFRTIESRFQGSRRKPWKSKLGRWFLRWKPIK